MLRDDFTFTKRKLGLFLLAAGLLGMALILSVDVLDTGREGGVGPVQRVAVLVMLGAVLTGLSLLPLGDDPA